MRALLVHPSIPTTYWGFQYSTRIVAKPASLPPLGLITLAALLPADWELRLVDLDVRALREDELAWADVVLVGGMLIQAASMREVIRRARTAGVRVVAGGPAPTSTPELFREADVVFRGEAEGRVGELLRAVETCGQGPVVVPPPAAHPEMSSVPLPRFDLLDLSRYASMSVQFSRGCPFSCEFCDVVELFGRIPRVKTPAQVEAELDALHALGYRGSLFFVDDNFIGNRRAVRQVLPVIRRWQEGHGRPFELYTEASVNLARDPILVREMVAAGFTAVFVGIETPSREALAEAGKGQNLLVDPGEAVTSLTQAGIEVMGGFIVGFDADPPDIFERQAALIRSAPMPLAMVGVLSAVPGTALWHRFESEARLRRPPSGDQFERPNFRPAMDEARLLHGYAALLAELYSPRAYYRRCAALLAQVGDTPATRGPLRRDIHDLLRALLFVGVLSPRRRHFWRLLAGALPAGIARLRRAVVLAVKGEHMIRYTAEHVLPRIAGAAAEALAERAAGRPTRPQSSEAPQTVAC
jgi:radical SAM superfamily enzyme YgiQ (UPF0313 family)